MRIFLATCFLTITFLSQGWAAKHYLIKTADEDDGEPYITNTVIKIRHDTDEDGMELLEKNLKGENLEHFHKMTRKQKEKAAAVLEEKIAEVKETGQDYLYYIYHCYAPNTCNNHDHRTLNQILGKGPKKRGK